jgi:aminoglycoside 6'-N-acetyltransferase I
MRVRRYQPEDRREYQRMRHLLWPDSKESEIDSWFARDDVGTFIALRDDGSLCGFVEVGSRPYAEGCETSPVGYIEGWWVDPDMRKQGTGRALLRAAEDWARSMGYKEMGSDALIDNRDSHGAHGRCGYLEVERIVTFRKPLA